MAKKHNSENEFLNPFGIGVNYKMFLEAIPKGTTVKEYCEGNLTNEQIDWLENDLTHYQESLEKQTK